MLEFKCSPDEARYADYELFTLGLFEKFPCSSKTELTVREGAFIRENECVNKYIPGRTKKEYNHQYYEDNQDAIKTKQNKYYQVHKDAINIRHKQYQSRVAIAAKRKSKIQCTCGSVVSYINMSRHKQSKKHLTSEI